MKILSWRGPRDWSKWHLVATDAAATLCRIPVPPFAAMSFAGPTEPEDARVCRHCREGYGLSSAVTSTLALLDDYQPKPTPRWRYYLRHWVAAAAPLLALVVFDLLYNDGARGVHRDLVGLLAVGGAASPLTVGLQTLAKRMLGWST